VVLLVFRTAAFQSLKQLQVYRNLTESKSSVPQNRP